MRCYLKIFVLLLILPSCRKVAKHIELPGIFSNDMVIQRDIEIPVWGKAEPNSSIFIKLNESSCETVSDDSGYWKAMLPPMKAGGPYDLLVAGKDTLRFHRVMIGEVWLVCGSTTVAQTLMPDSITSPVSSATDSNLHFLDIRFAISFSPKFDLNTSGWMKFKPDSATRISSLGFYMARKLYDSLHVPVGIIQSAYYLPRTEAWISADSLQQYPPFQKILSIMAAHRNQATQIHKGILLAKYNEKVQQWQSRIDSMLESENETDSLFLSAMKPEKWKTMILPTKWESAGLSYYDGLVWFVRDIRLPGSWTGKELRLELGSIDDIDVSFAGKTRIGRHTGYNDNRSYTIPTSVSTSSMRLSVKVIDAGGGGGFTGLPSDMKLRCGGDSMSLAGEWKYIADFSYHDIPDRPQKSFEQYIPTVLYNAMLHPIIPYAVKGIVCSLGEANYLDPYLYRSLIKTLIRSWRQEWNRPDMPVFLLQAQHSLSESIPEIREAQYMAANSLPHTYIICAIDLARPLRSTPLFKKIPSNRASNTVLNIIYNKKCPYSGPRYSGYSIAGKKVIVEFETFGKNMITLHDKFLKGFEIAGSDGSFLPAEALIIDNRIMVWNNTINTPSSVRYAWKAIPEANLYDTDTLPAFPFKTDSWYRVRVEKDFETIYLEELLQ